MMHDVIPVIVDANTLHDLQAANPGPGGVVVADVRWVSPSTAATDAKYEAGHLPGAVWVDLHHQPSAALDAPATEGRHPFPAPDYSPLRWAARHR